MKVDEQSLKKQPITVQIIALLSMGVNVYLSSFFWKILDNAA